MPIDPQHELPRRAWLGLEVDARLVVSAVDDCGPGARAGLAVGDAIAGIDGALVVPDPRELVRSMRAKRVGDAIALSIVRAGAKQTVERTLTLAPLPTESFEGALTELAHVSLGTHRLRTIVTRPLAGETGARRAALLILPGLDATSMEHPLEPDLPTRALVRALVDAGTVTMRVERSGVGDSEGPPCAETGLDEELATHDAAIEALLARGDVDPARIFLFAPSFGGMIAPLLARTRALAGIVVFGSSARPWDDCVMSTMIRQKKLAGTPPSELAPFVARWAELVSLVVREGWTPEDAFRELPHLRACRSRDAEGRTLFGRDVALFQRLVQHDLVAAWRAVRCRVLVLHGEHDWVSSLDEAREIADAARAELVQLRGIGHDQRAHASLRESFERKVLGESTSLLGRTIVEWIETRRA